MIDQYGDPHESTDSQLTWHAVSPWKPMVATRTFFPHEFPGPHIDAVESFLDYRVPADKFSALAEFDGSVIVERTAGEVSARCHDEQANFLALNLMHDIVTGTKTPGEARDYYAKDFLDYRAPATHALHGRAPVHPGGERHDRPPIEGDVLPGPRTGRTRGRAVHDVTQARIGSGSVEHRRTETSAAGCGLAPLDGDSTCSPGSDELDSRTGDREDWS